MSSQVRSSQQTTYHPETAQKEQDMKNVEDFLLRHRIGDGNSWHDNFCHVVECALHIYCLCKSDWDRGSYKKFHHYVKQLRAILASVALQLMYRETSVALYLMYRETSVALYLMYRETSVALYLMYRKIFLKVPAKVHPSKD